MARGMPDPLLDELVARLESTAGELRGGELAPERAAALVDDCARLASEAGAELVDMLRRRCPDRRPL